MSDDRIGEHLQSFILALDLSSFERVAESLTAHECCGPALPSLSFDAVEDFYRWIRNLRGSYAKTLHV